MKFITYCYKIHVSFQLVDRDMYVGLKPIHTVNDLFSAQCAKERLFSFNIWWEKKSPFSAPIMKHFPG